MVFFPPRNFKDSHNTHTTKAGTDRLPPSLPPSSEQESKGDSAFLPHEEAAFLSTRKETPAPVEGGDVAQGCESPQPRRPLRSASPNPHPTGSPLLPARLTLYSSSTAGARAAHSARMPVGPVRAHTELDSLGMGSSTLWLPLQRSKRKQLLNGGGRW